MPVKDLRSKRVAAEIPATLLAAKAGVNRSRLSNLERGYAQPTDEEVQRLNTALDELIQAKSVIDRAAASVGWPIGSRHDH
jgi:predicted transcriptional regulator